MFVDALNVRRDILRQGDIVKAIHLLGAVNLRAINYTYAAGNREKLVGWSVPSQPRIGDGMVLSHSCEIAPQNKMKLTSIIVAPLRDIRKATKPEQIERLIQSNRIDETNPEASFLKYFYIAPNDAMEFSDGAVVDFSKCFSVRKQCYSLLLEKKVGELEESVVESMALKLALYFHRSERPQWPRLVDS